MELLKETHGRHMWGVLFEPGGKIIFNFYWNLGKETNNKDEAYTLLKVIHLENQ
jgi:hypothetical protein